MPISTYYQVLEVSPSASQQEIKRAFRRLAFKYHPDANQSQQSFSAAGAAAVEQHSQSETHSEHFNAIVKAYRVLSDPVERKRYDKSIQGSRSAEAARKHFSQHNRNATSANSRKANAAKGRGVPRTGLTALSKKAQRVVSARLSSLAQQVTTAFARACAAALPRSFLEALLATQNSDFAQSKSLAIAYGTIRFEDAFRGGTFVTEVTYQGRIQPLTIALPPLARSQYEGHSLVVRLPAGTISSAQPTTVITLLLQVLQNPHCELSARGLTLHMPISPKEALEGIRLALPSFDTAGMLTIPPHWSPPTEFRLRAKGPLDLRTGKRLDLYVRPFVVPATAKLHHGNHSARQLRNQLRDFVATLTR